MNWQRYTDLLCKCPKLGMTLDVSRMRFDDAYLKTMAAPIEAALDAMQELENGAIANPDEERMVGHYWLRNAALAPDEQIRKDIEQTLADVKAFVADVHAKNITPPGQPRFTDLLVIGIGGSALGPQLVADALGTKRDKLRVSFFDNTDPDGMARVIAQLGARLKSTLVLVISKSGGTKETRNGMLEAEAAFKAAELDFPKHAVAVTGVGSNLDQHAQQQSWLQRFPMWDFVGGRTSVMSAVGLLPMALQGLDIEAFLAGAAEMDEYTRQRKVAKNPAALLALMWYYATNGRGEKDMVILPYKDRLVLMSRYLQQLIMESLGKEKDLEGNIVEQGISVYGNKGSTDQHAFVQQLRDGLRNFFVTFIVVLQDRAASAAKHEIEVEPGVTSGDYLNGFWQGTRTALSEAGRESMTITFEKLDAKALGGLIALYERTVGLYAALININAYHQPGVEAGKKAAGAVIDLQHKIAAHMRNQPDPQTPEEIAAAIGENGHVETVFHILEHLAANKRGVARMRGKFVGK